MTTGNRDSLCKDPEVEDLQEEPHKAYETGVVPKRVGAAGSGLKGLEHWDIISQGKEGPWAAESGGGLSSHVWG